MFPVPGEVGENSRVVHAWLTILHELCLTTTSINFVHYMQLLSGDAVDSVSSALFFTVMMVH